MESRNGKRMMTAAGRFAYSRFALNYAIFYETMADLEAMVFQTEKEISPAEREMAEGMKAAEFRLHVLVGKFLEGSAAVEDVDTFRNAQIRESEKLMAYLDCFAVYDYVLKRIRGRFFDMADPDWSDEEAVDKMMGYVVAAQDASERNQRIKSLLSELPMRFTRTKIFSMVRQAMTVYEGIDQRSMGKIIDMLEQEALLTLPDKMEEGHEQLHRLLITLENADYQNLDSASFSVIWEVFEEAENILFSQSSDRMSLMQLINDFYVMCLTGQDLLMDGQEKEDIHSLITLIWEKTEKKDYSLDEEELTKRLVPLEGRQEACYEQWSRYEGEDSEVFLGEGASKEDKEKVRKVELLLSTSIYMSLEESREPQEDKILLSRKAVEEQCQPFFDALEADWKKKPKCVVRAMMASLLSKLPMFFRTSDELRRFLADCLLSCTDLEEKNASLEEIRSIMEMDDAMV